MSRLKCLIVCVVWVPCCVLASPFSRPDQSAQRLMDEGKAAEAAAVFASPEHRAMALHESGDVAGAMEHWSTLGNARSEYNLGTALTRAGDYERAMEAFDRAAALPDTPGGNAHNRDIAEQLHELQQQQQQQQDEPGEGDQGGEQGQSGSDSTDSGEAASSGQTQPDGAEPQTDQAQSESAEPENTASTPPAQADETGREGDQAAEQLLNRVPDDPAGLLRARIMREHQRRHHGAGDAVTPW